MSLSAGASGPGPLTGAPPPPFITGHGGDVSTGELHIDRPKGPTCGTAGVWYKYVGANTWTYGFSMALNTSTQAAYTSLLGTWSGEVKVTIVFSNGGGRTATYRIPITDNWTSSTPHHATAPGTVSWVKMRATWHLRVYKTGQFEECFFTMTTPTDIYGPKDYA